MKFSNFRNISTININQMDKIFRHVNETSRLGNIFQLKFNFFYRVIDF